MNFFKNLKSEYDDQITFEIHSNNELKNLFLLMHYEEQC